MDLVGPFKGDPEYTYALTMTCAFSKYVKTHPLKTKEGKEVATAFYNEWVCSFGCPEIVVSDNGREFLNDFTHSMMLSLGISHKSSLPYRAAGNGQIEIFHKSLNRHLRAFMDGHKSNFSQWLKPLEFVHNTAVSRATKQSPFCLFYTFSPRFQQFDQDGVANLFAADNESHEPLERIRTAMKEAKENNEDFRSAYNHRFNSGRKKFPFKQGDLVLLHSPLQALRRDRRERVEGLNPKLSRPWCGPCRILKVWDETPGVLIEFSLSSGIKGKFKVHQDRLKEYFLSRGECDPFLHPLKHKKWKTEQLGGQEAEAGEEEGDEEVQGRRPRRRRPVVQPHHQMRLRKRQGVPEEFEEDKMSLQSYELSLPDVDDEEEEFDEVEEGDEGDPVVGTDPEDVGDQVDRVAHQWELWQAPSRLLPRPQVDPRQGGTPPVQNKGPIRKEESGHVKKENNCMENYINGKPEQRKHDLQSKRATRAKNVGRVHGKRTVMLKNQVNDQNKSSKMRSQLQYYRNGDLDLPEPDEVEEKSQGDSLKVHHQSEAPLPQPKMQQTTSAHQASGGFGRPAPAPAVAGKTQRLWTPWLRRVFYRKKVPL